MDINHHDANKISLVKTKINKKEIKTLVVNNIRIDQPLLQIPLFILFRALGRIKMLKIIIVYYKRR